MLKYQFLLRRCCTIVIHFTVPSVYTTYNKPKEGPCNEVYNSEFDLGADSDAESGRIVLVQLSIFQVYSRQ